MDKIGMDERGELLCDDRKCVVAKDDRKQQEAKDVEASQLFHLREKSSKLYLNCEGGYLHLGEFSKTNTLILRISGGSDGSDGSKSFVLEVNKAIPGFIAKKWIGRHNGGTYVGIFSDFNYAIRLELRNDGRLHDVSCSCDLAKFTKQGRYYNQIFSTRASRSGYKVVLFEKTLPIQDPTFYLREKKSGLYLKQTGWGYLQLGRYREESTMLFRKASIEGTSFLLETAKRLKEGWGGYKWVGRVGGQSRVGIYCDHNYSMRLEHKPSGKLYNSSSGCYFAKVTTAGYYRNRIYCTSGEEYEDVIFEEVSSDRSPHEEIVARFFQNYNGLNKTQLETQVRKASEEAITFLEELDQWLSSFREGLVTQKQGVGAARGTIMVAAITGIVLTAIPVTMPAGLFTLLGMGIGSTANTVGDSRATCLKQDELAEVLRQFEEYLEEMNVKFLCIKSCFESRQHMQSAIIEVNAVCNVGSTAKDFIGVVKYIAGCAARRSVSGGVSAASSGGSTSAATIGSASTASSGGSSSASSGATSGGIAATETGAPALMLMRTFAIIGASVEIAVQINAIYDSVMNRTPLQDQAIEMQANLRAHLRRIKGDGKGMGRETGGEPTRTMVEERVKLCGGDSIPSDEDLFYMKARGSNEYMVITQSVSGTHYVTVAPLNMSTLVFRIHKDKDGLEDNRFKLEALWGFRQSKNWVSMSRMTNYCIMVSEPDELRLSSDGKMICSNSWSPIKKYSGSDTNWDHVHSMKLVVKASVVACTGPFPCI
eukprot:jgi/Bigna1/90950/estExt_fgenesh1_pg.C_830085